VTSDEPDQARDRDLESVSPETVDKVWRIVREECEGGELRKLSRGALKKVW